MNILTGDNPMTTLKKRLLQTTAMSLTLAIGSVGLIGTAASDLAPAPAFAGCKACNPCAAKNPCGAANPCAAKCNPCKPS